MTSRDNSLKQTEVIGNIVVIRIYMGYIGNFGGWFQNMTNIICSHRGKALKLVEMCQNGVY